jgi:rare lipoprotein A (peptidoglycan hydrolase)
LLLGSALAAPQLGWASSGGAGIGGPSSAAGTIAPAGTMMPTVPAQPADVTVSASGDGITLESRASALLSKQLEFSGSAAGATPGETVVIERSGKQTDFNWMPTATATVNPDGTFAVTWTTNHIGRFSIRALLQTTAHAADATGAATPTFTVTVYRPSLATLYGPGFYGQKTACGQVLRRGTIGVAHRTLPCGTPVAVYYQGRTLIVPVIDRGPYANRADWDLTMATAAALKIPGTATVGAVSLPRSAVAAANVSRSH